MQQMVIDNISREIANVKLNLQTSLLREVFLRVLRFSPLLKNQHF